MVRAWRPPPSASRDRHDGQARLGAGRSPVVLPIPRTLSIEHVRENLAALELQLEDPDDIAA